MIVSVESDQTSIATLDLAIMAGREVLWSGAVRVNNSGANYSQSLREAQEPCAGRPADTAFGNSTNQRQLSFSISRSYVRNEVRRFNVRVEWTRVTPACEGGGTRSVRLEQPVDLVPGQTLRLAGDAGLTVAITLRKD